MALHETDPPLGSLIQKTQSYENEHLALAGLLNSLPATERMEDQMGPVHHPLPALQPHVMGTLVLGL